MLFHFYICITIHIQVLFHSLVNWQIEKGYVINRNMNSESTEMSFCMRKLLVNSKTCALCLSSKKTFLEEKCLKLQVSINIKITVLYFFNFYINIITVLCFLNFSSLKISPLHSKK